MATRGREVKTRPRGKPRTSRKPARVGRAKQEERAAATTKRRKVIRRPAKVARAALRRTRAAVPSPRVLQARLRRCMQRIAVLEAEIGRISELRAKERRAARLRMSRARRQFEARLTAMVQEIGQLRHHEVRARTLARKLAALD